MPLLMAPFRCRWLSPDAGFSVPLPGGRLDGSSDPMLVTNLAVDGLVPLPLARSRCQWLGAAAGASVSLLIF